ncbi:MAG: CRISPR system precrRNA processing endoribonuclease RAMP protein Cas6 [Bryobacteraceae bacterium]
MAGNIFRGAFGQIFRRICDGQPSNPYARIFEPQSMGGPSGFADAPRPFVLRPQGLDERSFQRGDTFFLDVHLFDLDEKILAYFILAFLQFAREGLGPGRVPVELTAVRALTLECSPGEIVWSQGGYHSAALPAPLQIDLRPVHGMVERLRVEFRTPTELKSEGSISRVPEFAVLFGRVRDRISTLASLYGHPLDFDFKTMGTRSKTVRLTDYQVQWEQVRRRSSRTGQQHSIGGFVGWAEYEGNLNEFVPWLQAGYWSGVGRQTVWGKGELLLTPVRIADS